MLQPYAFHPIADIRRHWAVYLGLIVALAIWCRVDVARRAMVDPARPSLHMTDFTVYTEAGAAFFDGREPYDVTNIRGWKYLYPPLFALLVAPLSAVQPHWQATAWFMLSALMAFGCYFECRYLASAFSPVSGRPFWLFVTALLAALFPALNCLQRGQMGIALVYPLLLGFRLIWLGRTPIAWSLGGVALALPIALKLTPALPAGCALAILIVAAVCRRTPGQITCNVKIQTPGSSPLWPACGLVCGSFLFLLLLPAALIGWNENLRHLETWYVRVASRVNDVRDDDFGGDVASLRNQSLHNAVYRGGNWIAHAFFGGPDDLQGDVTQAAMPMDAPIVSYLLSAARIAALAALGVVIVVAGRSNQPLLHGAAFGLAGVATLVVSPVSRGHYFVFWLPAAMFVPLWFHQISRPRGAFILAVVPAALTVAHYALLPYAGRMGLLGLGTTVWFFTACHAVWASRANVAAAPPVLVDSSTARDVLTRAA